MFALINSNPEGYNFLGIFSSKELADKACNNIHNKINQEAYEHYLALQKENTEMILMGKKPINDETYEKCLENNMFWNGVRIIEVEVDKIHE